MRKNGGTYKSEVYSSYVEISQIPIQINNFLKIKNTNTHVFTFYEMTGKLNAGCLMTRADLISLCFADTAVLQTEGLWQPHLEQVYRLRCFSSIWSLPICEPRFGNFPNMSRFFIGILFALVTLMSPFQMFWDTMKSTHEKQRTSRINAVCVLTTPSAGQTRLSPSAQASLCPTSSQHVISQSGSCTLSLAQGTLSVKSSSFISATSLQNFSPCRSETLYLFDNSPLFPPRCCPWQLSGYSVVTFRSCRAEAECCRA